MNKQEAKLELEAIKKKSGFKSMSDSRWSTITLHNALSENFIVVYKDKLPAKYVSYYQDLSVEFILSGKIEIDCAALATNEYTTVEKYEQLKDVIPFDSFLENINADSEFLLQNKEKINDNNIEKIRFELLTEEALIELYPLPINHIYFYTKTLLTKSVIEKYEDLLDWSTLSTKGRMTEEAIIAFSDKIDWKDYDYWNPNPVPEQIINELFIDLDPYHLIHTLQKNRNLSEEFIRTHYKKFDARFLIGQRNAPVELLNELEFDFYHMTILFTKTDLDWEKVKVLLETNSYYLGTNSYVKSRIHKTIFGQQNFDLNFYIEHFGTKEKKEIFAQDDLDLFIENNKQLDPSTKEAIKRYEKLKNMFA